MFNLFKKKKPVEVVLGKQPTIFLYHHKYEIWYRYYLIETLCLHSKGTSDVISVCCDISEFEDPGKGMVYSGCMDGSSFDKIVDQFKEQHAMYYHQYHQTHF